MSPKRLIHAEWYIRHRNVIGYLVLAVGVFLALAGVQSHANDSAQNSRDFAARLAKANRETQQRILHQACVTAKESRGPLIDYLTSQIDLTDRARALGLLNTRPPELRRLQNESYRNLKTLLGVYRERQGEPCPPLP